MGDRDTDFSRSMYHVSDNSAQSHSIQVIGTSGSVVIGGHVPPSYRDPRRDCLKSLSFRTLDARRDNIATAHRNTCDWFFESAALEDWIWRRHNGVLWIKGVPGAGKSTLMKHIVTWTEAQAERPAPSSSSAPTLANHIVVAHFYNARGDHFEKSSQGMFRSILFQLFEQGECANLLRLFERRQYQDPIWTDGVMKDYLLREIDRQSRPVIIFVDALDECDDTEARSVVAFLEDLSIRSRTVRICLSSRHYPHISMGTCGSFVLENVDSHDADIARYVDDRLVVPQESGIHERLLAKAGGVFMWVVLVVEILNREFDSGNVKAMHKKLDELPAELDGLFMSILEKDSADAEDTRLILQLFLVRIRPLTAEQLFFAVLCSRGIASIDGSEKEGDYERFIVNRSRGLIRTSRRDEQVEFIHQSVADFFLRRNRLAILDPSLLPNPLAACHNRAAHCCLQTLQIYEEPKKGCDNFEQYPFHDYAFQNAAWHAEQARRGGIAQTEFVKALGELDKFKRSRHRPNLDKMGAVIPYLSQCGGCSILQEAIEYGCNVNARDSGENTGLIYAAKRGDLRSARLLIAAGADVNAEGRDNSGCALQGAAMSGSTKLVKTLLEAGADVNQKSGVHGTALQAATLSRELDSMIALISAGANVNATGGILHTALHASAHVGGIQQMRLLLSHGADVNIFGGEYFSPLLAAAMHADTIVSDTAEQDSEAAIKLLAEAGAGINSADKDGKTALHHAARNFGSKVVTRLLMLGANPLARCTTLGTPRDAALTRPTTSRLFTISSSDTFGRNKVIKTLRRAELALTRFLSAECENYTESVSKDAPASLTQHVPGHGVPPEIFAKFYERERLRAALFAEISDAAGDESEVETEWETEESEDEDPA